MAAASASAEAVGVPDVGPKAEPAKVAPELRLLREQTQHVRALLNGQLEVGIDPSSLFDVDIDEPNTIAVEARRLAAVIERSEEDSTQAAKQAEERKTPKKAQKQQTKTPRATGDAAAAPEAVDTEKQPTNPELWQARIELDRARLDFYRLDAEARTALLAKHAEQRAAADDAKNASQKLDDEAAQAEKGKQQALEAARESRSMAERMVHEEYARLLGVSKQQARFEKKLLQKRDALHERHDAALRQRRLVAKLIELAQQPHSHESEIDAAYVALRKLLKETRAGLTSAIDALASDNTEVPKPGKDPLTDSTVDRSEIDRERRKLDRRSAELANQESELSWQQARLLMADMEMLNRTRLELLPYISPQRSEQVTSFGSSGLEQAQSELLQVWLTLRYHLHVTKAWAQALRTGSGRGASAWAMGLLVLKWTLPIALFIAWRRRAQRTLLGWRAALGEAHRKRYGMVRRPSWTLWALDSIIYIRRPLEWLLLWWSVVYFLPSSMHGLLEVEILVTVFSWTLGGALVVNLVNFLSSGDARGLRRAENPARKRTALLRLRSLRLMGWAIVTVGLLLALSAKLVGRGTIYGWVFSACWFTAIPILLIVAAWWKRVIFDRIEHIHTKGSFQRWVLNNRRGAKGFVAAVVGGAYLFTNGALRALRRRAVTFALVRSLLAYLFRRGLDKKAVDEAAVQYSPIDASVFAELDPELPAVEMVPGVSDDPFQEIMERIGAEGGGVFAVVGERGAGKTTLIERVSRASHRYVRLACQTGEPHELQRALNRALSLDESTDLARATLELVGRTPGGAVLIDDAHRLILPMLEGLDEFDLALDLARQNSKNAAWVFAIDRALWRFLERARGAESLFDHVVLLGPWSESGIARLLNHRNAQVGITPSFESLLSDLPRDANDTDSIEALQFTEASFYRMVWDYALGNPGVALHFWRRSLAIDPEGCLCARPFDAPTPEDLDALPDSTVFVLRAAVQLESATPEQICQSTALTPAQVEDALRHGCLEGYWEQEGGRYTITWNWYRAITRLLMRRRLLFLS